MAKNLQDFVDLWNLYSLKKCLPVIIVNDCRQCEVEASSISLLFNRDLRYVRSLFSTKISKTFDPEISQWKVIILIVSLKIGLQKCFKKSSHFLPVIKLNVNS